MDDLPRLPYRSTAGREGELDDSEQERLLKMSAFFVSVRDDVRRAKNQALVDEIDKRIGELDHYIATGETTISMRPE